jgi:excinuclease ABC subunit C
MPAASSAAPAPDDEKPVNDYFPDAPDYVGGEPEPEEPVTIKARERFRPLTVQGYGKEEVIRFRTEERIFLPGRKNPVTFATNSPALFLLERIRNETHRTAINYHRKLRQKTNRRSMLDEVPGVGPKRKKLLLRHFGSLSALKAATPDEIAAVAGVSRDAAENVYQFLRAHGGVDGFADPGVRIEVEEEMLPEDDQPEDMPTNVGTEKPEDLLDPTDRRRLE